MVIKQILVASILVLACSVDRILAFVTPCASLAVGCRGQGSVRTSRTRSVPSTSDVVCKTTWPSVGASGALKACRRNNKKEKVKRNRIKNRRFEKNGETRKKIVRAEYNERMEEERAKLSAVIFQYSYEELVEELGENEAVEDEDEDE